MRYFAIPLILLAAACQQAPKGERAPVTEAEATKIAETTEASFSAGNPDAIMGHYADDASMIDAAHANPSKDRKKQAAWTKSYVSMQPADLRVTDRDVKLLGPDAFVTSGIQSFTVAAGSARPVVRARFTDVYQRQKDGSWKIVHEHVSMPPAPTGAAQ